MDTSSSLTKPLVLLFILLLTFGCNKKIDNNSNIDQLKTIADIDNYTKNNPYLDNIYLFPNPTSDILDIIIPNIQSYSNGKIVISDKTGDFKSFDINIDGIDQIRFDFSKCNPGIYNCEIQLDNNAYVYQILKIISNRQKILINRSAGRSQLTCIFAA